MKEWFWNAVGWLFDDGAPWLIGGMVALIIGVVLTYGIGRAVGAIPPEPTPTPYPHGYKHQVCYVSGIIPVKGGAIPIYSCYTVTEP